MSLRIQHLCNAAGALLTVAAAAEFALHSLTHFAPEKKNEDTGTGSVRCDSYKRARASSTSAWLPAAYFAVGV